MNIVSLKNITHKLNVEDDIMCFNEWINTRFENKYSNIIMINKQIAVMLINKFNNDNIYSDNIL